MFNIFQKNGLREVYPNHGLFPKTFVLGLLEHEQGSKSRNQHFQCEKMSPALEGLQIDPN
jgi:hypothetical protein